MLAKPGLVDHSEKSGMGIWRSGAGQKREYFLKFVDCRENGHLICIPAPRGAKRFVAGLLRAMRIHALEGQHRPRVTNDERLRKESQGSLDEAEILF